MAAYPVGSWIVGGPAPVMVIWSLVDLTHTVNPTGKPIPPFTAAFAVSGERGARPWRVAARILELIDEKGDELAGEDDDNEEPPAAILPDAIRKDVILNCRRGPGPQAAKISGFKVEIVLVHPHGIGKLERHVEELAPEDRCQVQPAADVLADVRDEVALVAGRQLVDVEAADVHRRFRCLGV